MNIKMHRRCVLVLVLGLCIHTSQVLAQAVIVPSPIPALTNNCTLKWQTGSNTWVCASASAVSQPLTASLSLIADGTDATKILAFNVATIATGTTKTITWPNANITVPTTIASLSTNTFTGLQTANGGIATTTLTLSSTVQSDLLFTDATYDIGKSGATRPRDLFASRNVTVGGNLTAGSTGAATYTSSTGALRIQGISGSSTILGVVNYANTTEILKVTDAGVVSVGSPNGLTLTLTATTGTTLVLDGGGLVRTLSSSARYKEHIDPWVVSPETLTAFVRLAPRLWDYKGQWNGAGGFISEDLDALGVNRYEMSVLVNYDEEGRPESNRDFAIIGLQHLVLQQHDARLAALEAKLKDLEQNVPLSGVISSKPAGAVK